MIKLTNLPNETPYQLLQKYYKKALECRQESVEAICVSSLSYKNLLVDSRYVNLKYISPQFV